MGKGNLIEENLFSGLTGIVHFVAFLFNRKYSPRKVSNLLGCLFNKYDIVALLS